MLQMLSIVPMETKSDLDETTEPNSKFSELLHTLSTEIAESVREIYENRLAATLDTLQCILTASNDKDGGTSGKYFVQGFPKALELLEVLGFAREDKSRTCCL